VGQLIHHSLAGHLNLVLSLTRGPPLGPLPGSKPGIQPFLFAREPRRLRSGVTPVGSFCRYRSCYLSGFCIFWLAEQFLKQGSIVDDRLSEILRIGISLFLPHRNFVPAAIILDHSRVIDGNIGSPLFKIPDRVSFRGHHATYQMVRFY